MKSEIIYFYATKLADLIRERKLSSVKVVQVHLDRIEAANPKINAIVTLNAEGPLKAAADADKAVAKGENLGPLHGVPVTVNEEVILQLGSLLERRGGVGDQRPNL